jgi:hypothetical protein
MDDAESSFGDPGQEEVKFTALARAVEMWHRQMSPHVLTIVRKSAHTLAQRPVSFLV